MLFRGVMLTSLSGSLDGMVASHNRGGPYLRSRVVPVDPNTVQQNYCRDAMTSVDSAWKAMSQADRDAWQVYAATITLPNRIGDRRTITGRAAFFHELLPRVMKNNALDAGAGFPDPFPPLNPTRDFPLPPDVTYHSATKVYIHWPYPMGWEALPGDDGVQGIVLHLSGPQATTINWFRGPYKPAYWLESDEDTPPTSPFEADLSTSAPTIVPALVSGKRYFWSLRLFWDLHPNGRSWTGRFDVP